MDIYLLNFCKSKDADLTVCRWSPHLGSRPLPWALLFARSLSLFQKLPGRIVLSCFSKGNGHHDPFEFFSDSHGLSSYYFLFFHPLRFFTALLLANFLR
jgi:hypothetical protein